MRAIHGCAAFAHRQFFRVCRGGVRVYTDPSFILLVIQQTLARHIHYRGQSLGKGRELGELQGNMANAYQMCREDRGKHRGCSVAPSEGFTVNLILSHTARLSLHPTLACFPLRFLLIKKTVGGAEDKALLGKNQCLKPSPGALHPSHTASPCSSVPRPPGQDQRAW